MWIWVHKPHTGSKIHEMHQKYIEGNCVGTAGKRLLRREMRDARGEGGRWPPPLWAHWDRQAGLEKCSSSPCKWHPERLVSPRKILIPLLGLYSESPTPTYTVNGKVTFEKWGPHHDLIHWLTPGRGAFPPGRLCNLDWDYTSAWIFSLSPSSFSQTHSHVYANSHARINSISFHHWMKSKATSEQQWECILEEV